MNAVLLCLCCVITTAIFVTANVPTIYHKGPVVNDDSPVGERNMDQLMAALQKEIDDPSAKGEADELWASMGLDDIMNEAVDEEFNFDDPNEPPRYVELETVNFDNVIGKKHALLVFHSRQCGHCQDFLPQLNRIADAFTVEKDKLVIAGIEQTPKNELLFMDFEVQGYPTIIFRDGVTEKATRFTGARERTYLVNFINKLAKTARAKNGNVAKDVGHIFELSLGAKEVALGHETGASFIKDTWEAKKEHMGPDHHSYVTDAGVDAMAYYREVAEQIDQQGITYVSNQIDDLKAKIDAMLTDSSRRTISSPERDVLSTKINILREFLPETHVNKLEGLGLEDLPLPEEEVNKIKDGLEKSKAEADKPVSEEL